MRIFHQHPPRLDAANSPGSVAEQHDVAAQALDREVFVNGADGVAFGLRHHRVERVVRNRSAVGDGHKAAAAPSQQASVHPVAMKVGAIPSAARVDSLRKHFHDFVELRAARLR